MILSLVPYSEQQTSIRKVTGLPLWGYWDFFTSAVDRNLVLTCAVVFVYLPFSSKKIPFIVTWSQLWHSSWRLIVYETLTWRRFQLQTTTFICTSGQLRRYSLILKGSYNHDFVSALCWFIVVGKKAVTPLDQWTMQRQDTWRTIALEKSHWSPIKLLKPLQGNALMEEDVKKTIC